MGVHEYHPEATAAGVLSEYCEECCDKRLSGLDAEHLASCGVTRRLVDNLGLDSPELYELVMRSPAIGIQRDYLRRTNQTAKLAASRTPLSIPSGAASPSGEVVTTDAAGGQR